VKHELTRIFVHIERYMREYYLVHTHELTSLFYV